jgi:hypothetical protein
MCKILENKNAWGALGVSMWFRVLLAGLLLGGALGACALVDPVDNRYDTVSRSLAKGRNESIFLNLVRAIHDYPLSFTVVSNVTPSLTNTTSLALPSFLFGPHIAPYTGAGGTVASPLFTPGRDVIFGNTTASNTTAVSTNFSVSTQETSAFYEGFLKPIDLTTLDYFIRQGYPPELLFWLFTDTVEITESGRTFGYRYDPPNDYGCPQHELRQRCFLDFIHVAAASGLTIEEQTLQKSGGAAKGGASDASGGAAKPTTTVYPRFCFNQVLATRAKNAMGDQALGELLKYFAVSAAIFSPKCGLKWNPLTKENIPQADTFSLTVGAIKFTITPRSAYCVFEFLGAIMKAQREGNENPANPYFPIGRLDVQQPPMLLTVPEDPYLITVEQKDAADCFSHTWFYDGDYCVPERATTTKKIFSLLAQLIAIQTAAGDLSITPSVRIIQ